MGKKTNNTPYETDEQIAFVEYLEARNIKFTAIPNGFVAGGKNKFALIRKLKAEGLQNGFPDLMIFQKSGKHDLLFLEMKRQEGGSLSDEQKEWIDFLDQSGFCVAVAKGCDHAISILENYMRGELRVENIREKTINDQRS